MAAIDAAIRSGVGWLTLFAFSTENWARPQEEVCFLMTFNHRMIATHGASFHNRGIRVRYIGRASDRIPPKLLREMDAIQRKTRNNSALTLTFAFDYGGRAEIVAAVRRLVTDGVDAQDVNERAISQRLWFPDTPDPDLIIRTAGQHRLSNFFLWRAAYSELVFQEVLWPDFRERHFVAALRDFAIRTRRFGSVEDPDADHSA